MAEANRPHLHVEFHNVPIQDAKASREQGRPIFKDTPHCRIRWAGDKHRELDEPAHQKFKRDPQTNEWISYAEAFPKHWELFQRNQDQNVGSGTPISELPFLTEAKRAELRALNVFTAESLAGLDGAMLARLGMGARDLKNKAQSYLDASADGARFGALAEENARMAKELAELRQMIQGGNSPVVAPEPDPMDAAQDEPEQFASFEDEELKSWIADHAGRRPAGNPSRATLIRTAMELLEITQSKAASDKEAA